MTPAALRRLVVAELGAALAASRPDVRLDEKGYAEDFRDSLLPRVRAEDFEGDLRAGDGNELKTKFRAAHSSSGLAVNSFAPFRAEPGALTLAGQDGFRSLAFERKCPAGLAGRRPPNLDLVAEGPAGVIGIESKLTEYLSPHRATFSPAYEAEITDFRRGEGYFLEMQRLRTAPDSYRWLDAAQLIKHAFGLAHSFPDRPVTLLYLYWEPANPEVHGLFARHRAEIGAFAEAVSGATVAFRAMSYPDLWRGWRSGGATLPWLGAHLDDLDARYGVTLPDA